MKRYRIEFEEGGERRVFWLDEGETLSIGRAPDNGVIIPRSLVSAHHAVAEAGPDGLTVRDLFSRNGTWVDRERIIDARRLGAGGEFVIGSVRILVDVEPGRDLGETTVTILEEEPEAPQVVASLDTRASVPEDETGRAETFSALKEASRNLAVLHEMGSLLLEAPDEATLADKLLGLVFDVLPADRACVILKNANGTFRTLAARSREGRKADLAVSRTVLTRAINEGISLLSSDAVHDARFEEGASIILQGIRAVMCAPLHGRKEVLGAIYVDTKLQRGVFGSHDLELLSTLGIQSGFAMENLALLRENLRAERLAAIGGVMAGLSHDIRNILTVLRNGAYVMNEVVSASTDEDLVEAWDIVRRGMDTITELVEDMVSYSKERKPAKHPTDLNLVMQIVLDRFMSRAEEVGVTLERCLAPGLEDVPMEPSAIDRVVSNLLTNALDATAAVRGRVIVSTADVPGEASVEFRVEDDGVGIAPENLDRIFDLLFSTKGSKGTGFGLAVTKKIVTEHGGSVTVISAPGEGASFRVRLPRG